MPPARYHLLDLCGAPFDMGVRYGRSCRPQIGRLLAVRLGDVCRKLPVTPSRCLELAEGLRSSCEALSPSAIAEMEGIAEGSGLSPREIWFLQASAQTVIEPHCGGGCVAVGPEATESGGVLIGMNRDGPSWTTEHMLLIRRRPRGGPATIQFAYYGEIGSCGFNEAGLAAFDGALHAECPEAVAPAPLLCRVALESETAEACLGALKAAPAPACSLTIGDSALERIVHVEMIGPDRDVTYEGGGVYVHADLVHSPALRRWERISTKEEEESHIREAQMLLLADQHRCAVNVDVMKSILANHENYPRHSICRHNRGNGGPGTVASLVAEPTERRLYACLGPPCQGTFEVFDL